MATTTLSVWVSPCVHRPSSSPFCVSSARAFTFRASPNYASASSSLNQGALSRNLKLQSRQKHEARECSATSPVATMAPPAWPPVEPDTSGEKGDPSAGMKATLKQDGGEEKLEEQKENSEESFVWRNHWYPVSTIEDLDPSVPTPFQLLGRELVVWKDNQGEWRVFVDKCPHRLAPLSVSFRNRGNLCHSYSHLCFSCQQFWHKNCDLILANQEFATVSLWVFSPSPESATSAM